jgi:hypothetical protein
VAETAEDPGLRQVIELPPFLVQLLAGHPGQPVVFTTRTG